MSITSALQTGVSGLQANSTAVGGISENIANANTVGYRRGFAQMVTTAATGGGQSGVLSVLAVERLDIESVGGLISTSSATDLAIGGNGFFVVSVNPDDPVQTNYLLTRAGSFTPDQDGNLVNSAGFYLAGYPYNGEDTVGNVDRTTFAQMETVNIGDVNLTAAATTFISVQGNLPSQESGMATPGAPFVTSSEFFNALGESQRIELGWQPTATANRWEVLINDPDGNALGSVFVDFNDSGTAAGSPSVYSGVVSSAVAPAGFAFDVATGEATITLDNGAIPQSISVNLGAPGSFTGMTQFSGDFTQSFERDGSNVGELVRVDIDENGVLSGVFDNGQRRPLYEIPLAVVDNPGGLLEMKGNVYGLSGDSGGFQALSANAGTAGAINSGALEGSNVDIAQEMTDLIRVQRAFSTNAKVITTVDEMMEETSRLKR